jgi:hypothetical protein
MKRSITHDPQGSGVSGMLPASGLPDVNPDRPKVTRKGRPLTRPTVIENFTDVGVDVGRIVRRILSHVDPHILEGLRQVRLLDPDFTVAFARYKKEERAIEIYVENMIGEAPSILLKMMYPITYFYIGMVLGRQLDSHVHRNSTDMDREASSEAIIMNYIYPSFGRFKPIVRGISLLFRVLGRGADRD